MIWFVFDLETSRCAITAKVDSVERVLGGRANHAGEPASTNGILATAVAFESETITIFVTSGFV